MAAKLTRLSHKIAIQLHLVVESCTLCSSRSRRPVRKLLDTLPVCVCVWCVNMCWSPNLTSCPLISQRFSFQTQELLHPSHNLLVACVWVTWLLQRRDSIGHVHGRAKWWHSQCFIPYIHCHSALHLLCRSNCAQPCLFMIMIIQLTTINVNFLLLLLITKLAR
jgi:hypothetical protein